MPDQILPDLETLDAATARLSATCADVDDATARRPSLLPGWSVGHVLTHVARNADGMVNLVTWAVTGDRTPMYASMEARNAAIEEGNSGTRTLRVTVTLSAKKDSSKVTAK